MERRAGQVALWVLGLALLAAIVVSSVTLDRAVRAGVPFAERLDALFVPQPTVILPDPKVIASDIQGLARLETARMSLERVVRGSRNETWLWGVASEKLVFVARGEVVAGVDLSGLTEHDIRVLGPRQVEVTLPEPQLLMVTLDNEGSYVVDRDFGWFASVDADLETNVRRRAERTMRQDALEIGILDDARDNARQFVRALLRGLDVEVVRFVDEVDAS